MSKSKVEWSRQIPVSDKDTSTTQSLENAARKSSIRKSICDKLHLSLDEMQQQWGDYMYVRKQLFYTDASGILYPKNPVNVSAWKGIIRDYCMWHGITSLTAIMNMWCDIVDAFLSCPEFDNQVDPVFRAWIYGCMTKCVLQHRKNHSRTSPTFSPCRSAGKKDNL
jgi:hypothetical protein